jgi:hypothetical protein
MTELTLYADLLNAIKSRIRQAQTKAALSANAEMILMYWDIGRMIHERQQEEGWGAGVIPRLAKDIRNDIPEAKGLSERNIGWMIRFAREYKSLQILQQAAAKSASDLKVPQPVAKMRTAPPVGFAAARCKNSLWKPYRLFHSEGKFPNGTRTLNISLRKQTA